MDLNMTESTIITIGGNRKSMIAVIFEVYPRSRIAAVLEGSRFRKRSGPVAIEAGVAAQGGDLAGQAQTVNGVSVRSK